MTWLHAIPYPNISPVFLELGPLQFRWYGLMYLIGLAGAYFLIIRRVESGGLSMTRDQVYNMVVWAAFGVFIGGRLGYTLFYNFSYYVQHPANILAVWEGGMSFHGGLLGVIVALFWFSQRQGIPAYQVADLAAAATPIGLGFGRIGNFINGELYGRATDVDWCMVFPNGGPACRHPSQLYEAGLEGVFLFTLLWVIWKTATATRHHLLEFYHWLWSLSDDRGIRSRTGCPAWFYPWILLHGPTPLLPHGRGGSLHARHRLSAASLDAG